MSEIKIAQERFAVHCDDYKHYDTEKLREHFLVTPNFAEADFNWVYSHYDRVMVGSLAPQTEAVSLSAVDQNRSAHFLERRELGIINIGGAGVVSVDGKDYPLDFKEALYVGRGCQDVRFKSQAGDNRAKFYCLSAPAHQSYPVQKVDSSNAEVVELGAQATGNARTLRKLLVSPIIQTCQLQMGMTELQTGSVWNTMPPHTHSRRMEVYFYFELPDDQAVCHFMGPKEQTRHLWLSNEQAVLSPPWSMHCAAGTANYTFIWGMAGENLDYGDMDFCTPAQLR